MAEKGQVKKARALVRRMAPEGMMAGFPDRHMLDDSIGSAAADIDRAEP